MENSRICIGLCCFNSSRGLPYVIRNLIHLKDLFFSFQIIFYYDHSADNTIYLLKSFQNEYPEIITIIENPISVNGNKLDKIANARNNILKMIYNKFPEYEYFAMMDTNEYACIGELNLDVLKEVFSKDKITQWDSVSFDREAGYYDLWALSFPPFVYSFFHFRYNVQMVELMGKELKYLLAIQKKNRPNEFIPVYSAFNGFAIYKAKSFDGCIYTPNINLNLFPMGSIEYQTNLVPKNQLLNLFTTDCEHRHFHLQAINKNGAKIRIYPKSVFRKLQVPIKGLRGPA
jgi:hypothetical protein